MSVFAYGGLTLYAAASHLLPLTSMVPLCGSYNPAPRMGRFGLFPVRSPLLGESLLISVPLGTEMFHFPRFALTTYESSCQ